MGIIKVECDKCGKVWKPNNDNPVYSEKSGYYCDSCSVYTTIPKC